MVAISSRELAPRRGEQVIQSLPCGECPHGRVNPPGKRLLRVYIGAWIIALLFVGTHAGTALAVVYNGPYGYLDTEYRFDVISTFFSISSSPP
ncbi:unnamed protein product [Parascedosporium putredinis]|uniref:Uncharacterized protein n=1 Tax=Parascedosporium putredinis TaxID=1442378 RepID=A0A9P1H1T1_9PEZI|nr:unnamed protein product [Parascedosporium putredinis]CAI7994091.1 unnamed protein product [Parascedosporium putredinis]